MCLEKRSKRLLIASLVRFWTLFQLAQLMLFTEELLSKKRHLEAARVVVDYAGDVRQAIIALVQGNEFSEARRIVSISKSLS
jgi:hypothetical protein